VGELVATPFRVQDSSMMATFAQADCLIRRAPNAAAAKAGEWTTVVMLSGV
jgi:molybdopterin molybdotransferase